MSFIRFSDATTGLLITPNPVPAQGAHLSFKEAWLTATLPASEAGRLHEGHSYQLEVFSDPVHTNAKGSRYHTKLVDVHAALVSKRPIGGSVVCRFAGAWMPAATIKAPGNPM